MNQKYGASAEQSLRWKIIGFCSTFSMSAAVLSTLNPALFSRLTKAQFKPGGAAFAAIMAVMGLFEAYDSYHKVEEFRNHGHSIESLVSILSGRAQSAETDAIAKEVWDLFNSTLKETLQKFVSEFYA
jgi:hypothetical protein